MNNAIVGSLDDFSLGCDQDCQLNANTASQHIVAGRKFVLRYIGRSSGSTNPGDLTQAEAQHIIDAGLALGVVQHVRGYPWNPSADCGQNDGAAAASICAALGLPSGATVWMDLENVAAGTAHQDVIDHCNNWNEQVSNAGYIPGIYVGFNPGLTANELSKLDTTSFWKSMSSARANVPDDIPNRGYQMLQYTNPGLKLDLDKVGPDTSGNRVQFCLPQPVEDEEV